MCGLWQVGFAHVLHLFILLLQHISFFPSGEYGVFSATARILSHGGDS